MTWCTALQCRKVKQDLQWASCAHMRIRTSPISPKRLSGNGRQKWNGRSKTKVLALLSKLMANRQVGSHHRHAIQRWAADPPFLFRSRLVTTVRKQSIASAASPAPSTPTAATSNSDIRSSKSDGININVTGDKTRDKCLELIYDALAFDSGARKSSAHF